MGEAHRWPPPWLFSLLILPLGIIVGFKATPLPFLLAKAGVPADRIATVSSVANLQVSSRFSGLPSWISSSAGGPGCRSRRLERQFPSACMSR